MNTINSISSRKLLYLFTMIICFSSCGSFSGINERKLILTELNTSEFNGVFENEMLSNILNEDLARTSFLKEIDRKLMKDTLIFNPKKKYKFSLKVLNKKQTEIQYIEDDKVIRTRIIKSKIGRDGYLYLKNKNVKFIMLPYILGAIDVKRTRLTISPDNDLVLEVLQHRSGAGLLIVFLSFNNVHYIKSFERVEK